jgi:hypothetical protein
VHPEVGSPHGDEGPTEIGQGGLSCLALIGFAHHYACPRVAFDPPEALGAVLVAADAPFGLVAQPDLGDERADRRVPAAELNAGQLADQAASAIASDEVPGSQGAAVGNVGVDTAAVGRESCHLTAPIDRHSELVDPGGQNWLETVLWQRQPIVVPGGEIAYVQRDHGVPLDLHRLSCLQEPVGDAALVKHFDGPGM